MKKRIINFIIVIVISGILLFLWNGYASDGAEIFKHSVDMASAEIISVETHGGATVGEFVSNILVCKAKITSGSNRGNTVKVYQEYNSEFPSMKLVEPGDKVIIKNYPMEDMGIYWAVDNYRRTPALWILAVLFAALIIIQGRFKGLRTVVSLVYTCICIFAVFVPSVLSGKNIYVCAVLVCIFIIFMTLIIVNGFDKKTLCASLGCIGGVLAAAIIAAVFSKIMHFSGYTNEHSYYLTMLPYPMDLSGIGFCAIIIGAVGAVMDVSMSMSSSLYELRIKVPDITFKSLISSGFSIGQDMMGTMANTLVLAYVGSSLSSVLLILSYAESAADVFNREMIAYEIVQATAGSIGILLAIPVTALICGFVYLRQK